MAPLSAFFDGVGFPWDPVNYYFAFIGGVPYGEEARAPSERHAEHPQPALGAAAPRAR